MSNNAHQFEQNKDDEGVVRAANVASQFVAAVKGNEDAGRSLGRAVRTVAKESRIGEAFILRLVQPSRRPKSVDWGVGTRLVEAYLKFLRRQHRELEIKIKLVESLARSDRAAVRDLLDEAEALQNRVKALL